MSNTKWARIWSNTFKGWLREDEVYLQLNGNIVYDDRFESKFIMDDEMNFLQLNTGMVDSLGRPIFEGDIIHVAGWRFPRQVVKMHNGGFRGLNKYVGEGYLIHNLLQTNTVDVVGNIFENPDAQEK